jgi:hypothetical protein
MIKGREAFQPVQLGAMLQALAAREEQFFRQLKVAVA